MTSMPAPQPIEIGRLLQLLAALAAVLVVTAVLMSASPTVIPARSAPVPGPAVEVVMEPVPSHVQEGIVYGELAPGTQSGALILPAHMVESITYGQMEPPTG